MIVLDLGPPPILLGLLGAGNRTHLACISAVTERIGVVVRILKPGRGSFGAAPFHSLGHAAGSSSVWRLPCFTCSAGASR